MKETLQKRIHASLTSEEWDELINFFFYSADNFSEEQYSSAKEVHPLTLEQTRGVSYFATANFLFECETCKSFGINSWYKIILDTLGGFPYLRQFTNEDDLRAEFTGLNLSKLEQSDKTDYPHSGINIIPKVNGYVCDDCKDGVFTGEG